MSAIGAQLEIDELKQQNEYLESEVCRYANAIEEEYVPVFIHEEYKREMKETMDEMAEQLLKQSAVLQFATEENNKLKELTDGIMEEEGTGHILGCNAYEKFCQAMSELNYDEKWIGELKKQNKDLFKAWLYYWSDGGQGAEHPTCPMSQWNDGKYQRILEEGE